MKVAPILWVRVIQRREQTIYSVQLLSLSQQQFQPQQQFRDTTTTYTHMYIKPNTHVQAPQANNHMRTNAT